MRLFTPPWDPRSQSSRRDSAELNGRGQDCTGRLNVPSWNVYRSIVESPMIKIVLILFVNMTLHLIPKAGMIKVIIIIIMY